LEPERRLSKKELRRQLFEQDPHCHWCHCLTVWIEREGGGWYQENAATLDHLYTRYEMNKRVETGNPFVLACNKCNHDRGAEATKAQPIEELWRRAGQLDRMIREGRLTPTDESATISV
jgi:5-methylcytosine-specific restriction endonuclease McrA